jgi:hypothetical protein
MSQRMTQPVTQRVTRLVTRLVTRRAASRGGPARERSVPALGTTLGATLTLLAAGALAGCGDDSDGAASGRLTADKQTAADNLAGQIVTSGDVAGRNTVTREQATCIAEGTVGDVGLAALQRYGILTEDLKVDRNIQGVVMDRPDAVALAGVFVECVDVERLFERQFLAGAKLTREQRQCVRDTVDEESVTEVLARSFQGETAGVYDGLEDALAACGRRGGPDPSQ